MREILVVRHGESEWNASGRWQGWVDIDLTPAGVEQALARGRELAGSGLAFSAVFASDLVRASHTAELLAQQLGGLEVRTDPGFRERFGGRWQGLTSDELNAQFGDQLAEWRAGRLEAPPEGESTSSVLARFDDAVARAHEHAPAGRILVVTHGGALRVVARRAEAPLTSIVDNLGGLWFHYDGDRLHAREVLTPPSNGDVLE